MKNIIPPHTQEKITNLNPINKNIIQRGIALYLKDKNFIEEKIKKDNDFDSLLQIYKLFLILQNKLESHSPDGFSEVIKNEVQLDSYLEQLRSILFNGEENISLNDHVALNEFKRKFYSKYSSPELIERRIELFQERLQDFTLYIDELIFNNQNLPVANSNQVPYFKNVIGLSEMDSIARVASLLAFLLITFFALNVQEVLADDIDLEEEDSYAIQPRNLESSNSLHFNLEQTPTEVPDSTELTEEEKSLIDANLMFLEYSEGDQFVINSHVEVLLSSNNTDIPVRNAVNTFFESLNDPTQDKQRVIDLYNFLVPASENFTFNQKLKFVYQFLLTFFFRVGISDVEIVNQKVQEYFPIVYFNDEQLNGLDKGSKIEEYLRKKFETFNEYGTFVSSKVLYFCSDIAAACYTGGLDAEFDGKPHYVINTLLSIFHETWHDFDDDLIFSFREYYAGIEYWMTYTNLRELTASVMDLVVYRKINGYSYPNAGGYHPSQQIADKLQEIILNNDQNIIDLYNFVLNSNEQKSVFEFIDTLILMATDQQVYELNILLTEYLGINGYSDLPLMTIADKLILSYTLSVFKVKSSNNIWEYNYDFASFLYRHGLLHKLIDQYSYWFNENSILVKYTSQNFVDNFKSTIESEPLFFAHLFNILNYNGLRTSMLGVNSEYRSIDSQIVQHAIYNAIQSFSFVELYKKEVLTRSIINYSDEPITPTVVTFALDLDSDFDINMLTAEQKRTAIEYVIKLALTTNIPNVAQPTEQEVDSIVSNLLANIDFNNLTSQDWALEVLNEVFGVNYLIESLKENPVQLHSITENGVYFFYYDSGFLSLYGIEKDNQGEFKQIGVRLNGLTTIYGDLIKRLIVGDLIRNQNIVQKYGGTLFAQTDLNLFWDSAYTRTILANLLRSDNMLNNILNLRSSSINAPRIALEFLVSQSVALGIPERTVNEYSYFSVDPNIQQILDNYKQWWNSTNITLLPTDFTRPDSTSMEIMLREGFNYLDFYNEVKQNPNNLKDIFERYFMVELGLG